MTYWWVNQNQTWQQEIKNEYLWSPKTKSNGAYNQFYENMRHVKAGDMVFSYFRQQIRFLGVVLKEAVTDSKPSEFGTAGANWNSEGWLVRVKWDRTPVTICPSDYIEDLRPKLPEKYSPLQRQTGNGLQCVYLAEVPDDVAHALMWHLRYFRFDDPESLELTSCGENTCASMPSAAVSDEVHLSAKDHIESEQLMHDEQTNVTDSNVTADTSADLEVVDEPTCIQQPEQHAWQMEQFERLNELRRENQRLHHRIEHLSQEMQVLKESAQQKAGLLPQLHKGMLRIWRMILR